MAELAGLLGYGSDAEGSEQMEGEFAGVMSREMQL